MRGRGTDSVQCAGSLILAHVVLAQLSARRVRRATSCAREDFALAVDRAGAALRQLNADNAPRLRAKMRELKEARGWPDAGFEEKAYEILQDERMAALDMQANDLLAKLDTLGTVDPSARARLRQAAGADGGEPRAAGNRESQGGLHAGQARPDAGRARARRPKPKSTGAQEQGRRGVQATAGAARAQDGGATAQTGRQLGDQDGGRRREVAIARCRAAAARRRTRRAPTRPAPTAAEDEGYSIDEIMAASAGFFGKVSANLGAVIEQLFKKSGRPAGYILGTEGGGAFLAGVRYGKGTLYMRAGGTRRRSTGTGPRSAPTWAPTAPRRCS